MTGDATAERDESRALTGLRGVAALMVMLHHFFLKLALDEHLPMIRYLLRKGYLGVDLFFVLSGFVIAMVYGAWFDGSRPRGLESYGRFLVRRVARLWPLHAAVLLVLIVFDMDPPHLTLTPRVILMNLGMVQAWGYSTEINPPAWSISTELLAYLLFPVLAVIGLRGRAGPFVLVGLAIAAIAVCMMLAPPIGPVRRGWMDIYYNYSWLPLLRCLAGFMVGMAAWRAGRHPAVRRLVSPSWVGPAALALFVAALLGRVNDLFILWLLPVIVLGMHFGRGPVHRVFATGPVYALGVLSYAIYLIHATMLEQFPFGMAPMRYLLVLYFLSTVAAAALAHWLIERPGRRLMRGIGEAVLRVVFGGRREAAVRPPG